MKRRWVQDQVRRAVWVYRISTERFGSHGGEPAAAGSGHERTVGPKKREVRGLDVYMYVVPIQNPSTRSR